MGEGKDNQWKAICRKELLIEPVRTYRTYKSYSCLQIDYCLTEGRMCSQPQEERKAWLQVQMSLRFRWWEAEVWSVENEKWWGKDLQRVQKVLNFNPGEVGEWSFDHWGHVILLVFSGRTRVSPWAFLTYKKTIITMVWGRWGWEIVIFIEHHVPDTERKSTRINSLNPHGTTRTCKLLWSP